MCVCSYIQSHAPTHTAKIPHRRPSGVTRHWQHSFLSPALGYAAVERGSAISALAASSDRAPNRQGDYLQGKAGQGLRTPAGLRVTPKQCRLLRESQWELSLGRTCPRGGSSSLHWGAHTDQWDVAPLGWDVTAVPVRNSSTKSWAQAPKGL